MAHILTLYRTTIHTHIPQDPLIVARLLVVGRDCLLQTQYKVRASLGGKDLKEATLVGPIWKWASLHSDGTSLACMHTC